MNSFPSLEYTLPSHTSHTQKPKHGKEYSSPSTRLDSNIDKKELNLETNNKGSTQYMV